MVPNLFLTLVFTIIFWTYGQNIICLLKGHKWGNKIRNVFTKKMARSGIVYYTAKCIHCKKEVLEAMARPLFKNTKGDKKRNSLKILRAEIK